MEKIRNRFTVPLLLLAFMITAAGCAEKAPADVRIELQTPDGAVVTSSESSASDAVFPRFVSQNEDYQKELDKLNKEIEKIQKDYNKRTEKGKGITVRTYIGSSERVHQ